MRGRRAHQLAHVVDRDVAVVAQALGLLGFGHAPDLSYEDGCCTGWISSSESIRDCTSMEIDDSSPTIQPWL